MCVRHSWWRAAAYEILNKIEITLIVWTPQHTHTHTVHGWGKRGRGECVATLASAALTHQKAKTISEFDAQILVANVTANAALRKEEREGGWWGE